MTIANNNDRTPPSTGNTDIEKSYAEILQRGEQQLPGINELLDLFGQFQNGFKQSQEYLQLTQPIIHSSASNTSTP